MSWQSMLPEYPFTSGERALVVEAEPGRERRDLLARWLQGARICNTVVAPVCRLLDCDFTQGGVWAGVAELIDALMPRIHAAAPSLLIQHDTEITAILPHLRKTLRPRYRTLLDLAPDEERVQGFARGRAHRILHGAIDLLAALHTAESGQGPWILVCDHYGRAGELSRQFFRELVRRRGEKLDLTLVAVVDPGQGDAARAELSRGARVSGVRLCLAPMGESSTDPETRRASARAAAELEQRVADDPDALEASLPGLICLWQLAAEPEHALRWREVGAHLYARLGYYDDALRLDAGLDSAFEAHRHGDELARWRLAVMRHTCLSTSGQEERARQIVDTIVTEARHPAVLTHAYFTLSVHHIRHIPSRDLAGAEQYAQQASEALAYIDPSTERARSLAISVNNALALIRYYQRRYDEALALCHASLAILDAHFGPQTHRMHRASLHHHIAEVLVAVGTYQDAVAHYSHAIACDPHYPEYYNVRGIAYFKAGRFDEAEADFRQALALSPPYAEAFVNLGQCSRASGRADAAVQAYSSAIDLEPESTLALVGRAEAYELLGDRARAGADYDAALALSPEDPLVLANRAVLHYESGRLQASLDDLERALSRAPELAELFHNRAVVLVDLGRRAEAAEDLTRYLRLRPDADDRDEVIAKLSQLK